MPKGGHNRKSDAQKMIEGTYRKDRAVETTPVGQELISIPSPPEGLSKKAKMLWNNILNDLIVSRLATTIDVYALEIMVTMIEEYWELHEWIKDVDQTKYYRMKNDEFYKYKFVKDQLKSLRTDIRKYGQDFGMNPQARRTLLVKPKEETKDAFIELIG